MTSEREPTYRTPDPEQARAAERAAALQAAEQWAASAPASSLIMLFANNTSIPEGIEARATRDGMHTYTSIDGHVVSWNVFVVVAMREIDRRCPPTQPAK